MIEIKMSAEKLARLTGLKEDELQARLDEAEDAGEVVAELITNKIKKVGEDKLGQGTRKKALAIEKALAPILEKAGIDPGETTEDTLAALDAAWGQSSKGANDGLTKEQLTKHPAVIELLTDRAQAVAAKLQSEVDAAKAEADNLRTLTLREKARTEVATFLRENKAIVGQSTYEQAADIALGLIGVNNLALTQDGAVKPVQEGQPMRDELGNEVDLQTLIKTKWAFGFNTTDPTKSGGGAPPAGGQGAGGAGGKLNYATLELAQAALTKETDPNKRADIFAAMRKLV